MENAEKLEHAIATLKEQHSKISKWIFWGGSIPEKILKNHTTKYAPVKSDEKILFMVNKKTGFGFSCLLVTDKFVYYKCLKDAFLSSLIPIVEKGIIPLSKIESMSIGEHDHCYGTAYIGHQLVINGQVKGLLRMGGGVFYDEDLIDNLTQLFNALTRK